MLARGRIQLAIRKGKYIDCDGLQLIEKGGVERWRGKHVFVLEYR